MQGEAQLGLHGAVPELLGLSPGKRIVLIPGDDLVRSGPYVQPPYNTWIGSWRSQGFGGLTFKEANSRYRPGEVSREWTVTDLPRR